MKTRRDDDRCGNCVAFLPSQGGGRDDGYCRAHPPTALFLGMGEPMIVMGMKSPPQPLTQSVFPMMMAAGWCREHERKE